VNGAHSTAGEARAFLLVPVEATTCQKDLGFSGPGTLGLELCGQALASGNSGKLSVAGAAPFAPLVLTASSSFQPTPIFGGTAVPVSPTIVLSLVAGASGDVELTVQGGGGPATFYAQAYAFDPLLPQMLAFSNALEIEFLP
jgi:hypothetical protein